jgi:hypothetical protein
VSRWDFSGAWTAWRRSNSPDFFECAFASSGESNLQVNLVGGGGVGGGGGVLGGDPRDLRLDVCRATSVSQCSPLMYRLKRWISFLCSRLDLNWLASTRIYPVNPTLITCGTAYNRQHVLRISGLYIYRPLLAHHISPLSTNPPISPPCKGLWLFGRDVPPPSAVEHCLVCLHGHERTVEAVAVGCVFATAVPAVHLLLVGAEACKRRERHVPRPSSLGLARRATEIRWR